QLRHRWSPPGCGVSGRLPCYVSLVDFGFSSKTEPAPQGALLCRAHEAVGCRRRDFGNPAAEDADPAAEQPARQRHKLQLRLVAVALPEEGAQVAEPFNEAEFEAFLPGPELAGEEVRVVGERGATTFPDHVDERFVDLELQRLDPLHVLLFL